MKLAFLCEFGSKIGLGHLKRCEAIAEACTAFADVSFVLRPLQLSSLVPAKFTSVGPYEWRKVGLGFAGLIDRMGSFDGVIVDSYEIDLKVLELIKMKWPALKVFLVADEAIQMPPVSVDAVLSFQLYSGELAFDSELRKRSAIGGEYFPIRKSLIESASVARSESAEKRILVTMGGSDPFRQTERVLDAFQAVELGSEFKVQVILGTFFEDKENRFSKYRSDARIELIDAPENFDDLLKHCDRAITAAGTTAVELLYLRKSCLVFPVVENQFHLARAMRKLDGAEVLPNYSELSDDELRSSLQRFLLSENSSMRAAVIDGRGAERIATFIRSFESQSSNSK